MPVQLPRWVVLVSCPLPHIAAAAAAAVLDTAAADVVVASEAEERKVLKMEN
jgi:hypothetical protein